MHPNPMHNIPKAMSRRTEAPVSGSADEFAVTVPAVDPWLDEDPDPLAPDDPDEVETAAVVVVAPDATLVVVVPVRALVVVVVGADVVVGPPPGAVVVVVPEVVVVVVVPEVVVVVVGDVPPAMVQVKPLGSAVLAENVTSVFQ
jgi:hypothetical protein